MTRAQLAALMSLPLASAALLSAPLSCAPADPVRMADAAATRAIVETQFAVRYCGTQYRGQDDVMREVISNGTPRMPGFKHHFERGEIDAVVAYLKTVPAAPEPAARAPTQQR